MVEKIKAKVPACQVELYDLDAKDTMRTKIDGADILVNGTLLGMKPKEDTTVITDTTCITVPGKGMLLWQGVASFKLFTGKDMPVDEVKERFFQGV